MPKITYVASDGARRTIEAAPGTNVMRVAVSAGISGIVGECGGFCNCGTCHVSVDPSWFPRLPAPSAYEDELLNGTATERTPTSRLGCQIVLTDALDGITVTTPERQN